MSDAADVSWAVNGSPPSSSHSASPLVSFYHFTWNEEMEERALLSSSSLLKVRGAAYPQNQLNQWRPGAMLSKEVWLSRIHHKVFGAASTLPSCTRLDGHPCISQLHAKVITVTTKRMLSYFLQTFPLQNSSSEGTETWREMTLPVILVVNYSGNPVFVNESHVGCGRCSLLLPGDCLSFLESAYDSYGGVMTRVMREEERDDSDDTNDITKSIHEENNSQREDAWKEKGFPNRSEYCEWVHHRLKEQLAALDWNEDPQRAVAVVEEEDFVTAQDDDLWRWKEDLQTQQRTVIPVPGAVWCVPPLRLPVLRALYRQSFAKLFVATCVADEAEEEERDAAAQRRTASPIQEQWQVLGRDNSKTSSGSVGYLNAALPVYVLARDDRYAEREPITAQSYRFQASKQGSSIVSSVAHVDDESEGGTSAALRFFSPPQWVDLTSKKRRKRRRV